MVLYERARHEELARTDREIAASPDADDMPLSEIGWCGAGTVQVATSVDRGSI